MSQKNKMKHAVVYRMIVLLLPFAVLIGAELLLRALKYGTELELVRVIEIAGQKYYRINESFARRYFAGSEISIPEARNDLFRVRKSPNTYRIFCLGGSTTAGFPFVYNGTFPALLRDRLAALFPEREFEVVNWGISALNSYSVLDIIRELVKYQPDVFLIYTGHNEFYGALGVASTQAAGQNRTLVKAYITLGKSRLFHLIRNGISAIRPSAANDDSASASGTLMQQLAEDRLIPLHGEKYNAALNNFEANIREIIRLAKEQQITVLFGTLVSNVSDLEPFESVFADSFFNEAEWQQQFAHGQEAEAAGDFALALSFYRAAARLDSTPANLAFRMGKCYQRLGAMARADSAFARARDLDPLRFRASSEFNQVLRNICAVERVPLVDIEALFRQHSPHSLVGDEWICDHLHPNQKGYWLMAKGFFEGMAENDLIAPKTAWCNQREQTLREAIELAYVTDLELEIANRHVQNLTGRLPFKQKHTVRRRSGDADWEKMLQTVVDAVMAYQLDFDEASLRLAEYLIAKGAYSQAETYYRSIIKIRPMRYAPYIYLGNLFLIQRKYDEAEKAYLESLALSPDLPFAHTRLGLLYMDQKQPYMAQPYFEKAVVLAGNSPEFSYQDLADVHYLLALAYAQTQNYQKAVYEAKEALKMQPGNKKVDALLQKMYYAINAQK
ncbi:tetratricopeptide repeat protein [candidate division KSB1 bacterium]|nr:tetratricopeptide repeat protein [candidate division KSB1 bacterium]